MENLNAQAETWKPRSLITQAVISLVVVLPFIILELIDRQNFNKGFPLVLFVAMWILSFSFILLLMPLARSLRHRNLTSPLAALPRVFLLAVIASIMIRLVIDQMPCFLGVPNCD